MCRPVGGCSAVLTIIKLPGGIPLCPKFVQSNQATTTKLPINCSQLGTNPNGFSDLT